MGDAEAERVEHAMSKRFVSRASLGALAEHLRIGRGSRTVMPALEICSIKPGPDGLARITARRLDEPVSRSWLVRVADAEDAVLDEWAEFHDAVLGYPPKVRRF
jgi:hypothetical protein